MAVLSGGEGNGCPDKNVLWVYSLRIMQSRASGCRQQPFHGEAQRSSRVWRPAFREDLCSPSKLARVWKWRSTTI